VVGAERHRLDFAAVFDLARRRRSHLRFSGIAICENGEEAALAPGRVERELPDLVLAAERRRPAPPMSFGRPAEVRCCGEG
jgi:hypothetical protein